jgi:hypothetical protein
MGVLMCKIMAEPKFKMQTFIRAIAGRQLRSKYPPI